MLHNDLLDCHLLVAVKRSLVNNRAKARKPLMQDSLCHQVSQRLPFWKIGDRLKKRPLDHGLGLIDQPLGLCPEQWKSAVDWQSRQQVSANPLLKVALKFNGVNLSAHGMKEG
ncbi:MAG: hypothetical protein BWY82_01982 [Verrucomicrobia bacterium ADurb.Bin474]|nr:MAG: hypothetical protein BWY82_01982 [Verrucomicrobia bacterium ADurb.Bin474]